MKKLLLLLLSFVAVLGMSAEEVTLDFSNPATFGYAVPEAGKYTQVATGESVTDSPISIGVTYTTGNGLRFFANTNSGVVNLRAYVGSTMTIEAGGATITKIVINGSNLGSSYLTGENYADGTWEGSATSVVLNCIKSTVQMNTLTVTYEGGTTKTVKKPTFGGDFSFKESTQATLSAEEGCKIYYSYDQGDFDNVEDDCILYTAPITLTATTILYAQAIDAEGNKSQIASQQYSKVSAMTIAEVMAAASGTNVEVEATVVALCQKGAVIGDETGYMYYYANKLPELAIGDKAVFSGAISAYGGFNQMPENTVVAKSGTTSVSYPTATTLDGAGIDAWVAAPQIQYVTYTGKLSISGTYYNVEVEGATAKGSIIVPTAEVLGEITNGSTVTVTGFAMYTSGSTTKYINTIATSIQLKSAPQPEKVDHITIQEFLEKADPETTYELTGKVTEIKNTNYGNLYIEEDGVSLYLYGVTSPGKTFAELGISVGDMLTVKGKYTTYQETPQISNAEFVKVEKGEAEKITVATLAEFTNGGFETWTDGKLNQWQPRTTAGGATLEQSSDAHSGNYSVLVKGATSNKRLGSTEIRVSAGWYTYTIYAKAAAETGAARPGYVPVTLNEDETAFNSLTGKEYVYFADATAVTNAEWTKIQYTFQLEEDAIISILVMNPKNSGDVLIDDAELRTATEEEIIAAGVSALTTDNGRQTTDKIYDLQGRSVKAATRGLFIQNGVKVLR